VVDARPQDGTLVALELRRRGDAHFEPLHLMRQLLRDTSDFGSSDGERAGLGARVRPHASMPGRASSNRARLRVAALGALMQRAARRWFMMRGE
jgi:hypothetical protein